MPKERRKLYIAAACSSDSVMHLVPQWPIYKYPTQPYTAAAAAAAV